MTIFEEISRRRLPRPTWSRKQVIKLLRRIGREARKQKLKLREDNS